MLRTTLICSLIYLCCGCSNSQQDLKSPTAPLSEFNVDLTRANMSHWFNRGYPSFEELRWQILGWEQNSQRGFKVAGIAKKPLLLWLEDGHPLGATSEHGRTLRHTFSQDSIVAPINNFIIAADDIRNVPEAVISEGGELVVYTADATEIARTSSTDPLVIAEFLDAAHVAFAETTKAELSPELVDTSQRPENGFPDKGLALEVYTRSISSLDANATERNPWKKDFVWFNDQEIMQFVEPIQISKEINLAPELRNRIFSQSLSVAGYDISQSELTLKCNSIIGNKSTYLIVGSAHFQSGKEAANVRLRGKASFDSSRNQFGLLELIAVSELHNGEEQPQF
ncbi:MAG: hypothetical protein QGF46_08525, partial [Planctomycetota bacterium]|nr:hypothetical protein [Planctomycetota bacterium]